MPKMASSGPLSWWRRRSLQARLTAAATLVIVLGLCLGAGLLLTQLRSSLVTGLDSTARQRAIDVAALIERGALVAKGPTIPILPNNRRGDVLVQVIGANGQPLASTANIVGEPRLFTFAGTSQASAAQTVANGPIGDNASFRVVALAAGGDTIYAAVPLTEVTRSVQEVTTILVLGVPFAVLLFAGVGWLLVGRALRPVATLRREAAAIPGTDPHHRLELPTSHDEIRRLAETFNDLLGRVDDATVRQRQFVADAAHELRSPVASLRTQLEVSQAHPDRVDWGAIAPDLLEDTLRLDRLVDNLLQLARIDARPASRYEDVDLDEIVLAEVRRTTARHGIAIDASGVSAARVSGDPEGLGRAVRNLLDNAMRHAAKRVQVSLRVLAGSAILTIGDDGSGIRSADRERIFTRFTRLDDARARDAGGAGLGLAIVAGVTAAHAGTVSVADNQPGARFVIALPCTDG